MSWRVVGLIALLAGTSGHVRGVTCYEIVDTNDITLYRASPPPFPLAGPTWAATQAQLRAKRHHLMWFDTISCPVDFSSPLYAGENSKDAANILSTRSDGKTGGIYVGADANPPAAVGQRAIYVGPGGGQNVTNPGGNQK